MAGSRTVRILAAIAACLVLSACDAMQMGAPSAAPPAPASPVVAAEPTAKSAAATVYYAQIQQTLLNEGMLRTDSGAKVPFTSDMLSENFMRIALFNEYRRDSTGVIRGETETELRRWSEPVRVSIRFGASVAPDKQATDRARIASFLSRISRVTGHPVRVDEANPNFWIYIVSEDEREAMGPVLRDLGLGVDDDVISTITRMPQTTYCNVFSISGTDSHSYRNAVAVVRAEHPDLLRLSCFHEEIAQALGLPNDSPRARPSIFNDDEEFALLTDHDELLLRILYSPELRPGMTAAEARAIVESLARRLTGGES
ncbi:DUF2927 domain-containing protein [Tabrizicola sp.]|uniref:DUF2927 domain-containing protein n=1 Tax=Tabrizicola sp. TaxID=2005166 RepID=UPI003F2F78DA